MKERNLRWWKGHAPAHTGPDHEPEMRDSLASLEREYEERYVGSHAAWLPLPPSVNAAYKSVTLRVGRKVICRRADSQAKKEWLDDAVGALDAQRFPRLDPVEAGSLHFAVQYIVALSEWRRDINNETKLALDLVASRLGLDDRYEVAEAVKRLPVASKEQEGVLVRVNLFQAT